MCSLRADAGSPAHWITGNRLIAVGIDIRDGEAASQRQGCLQPLSILVLSPDAFWTREGRRMQARGNTMARVSSPVEPIK